MHHLHKCKHLTGAYELRTNAEVLEPDGPFPKVTPPLTAATLASNAPGALPLECVSFLNMSKQAADADSSHKHTNSTENRPEDHTPEAGGSAEHQNNESADKA